MLQSILVLIAFPVILSVIVGFIESNKINLNQHVSLNGWKRPRSIFIGAINLGMSIAIAIAYDSTILAVYSFVLTHTLYWLVFDISVNMSTGKDIFYTSYGTGNKETSGLDRLFNFLFKESAGEMMAIIKLIMIISSVFAVVHVLR